MFETTSKLDIKIHKGDNSGKFILYLNGGDRLHPIPYKFHNTVDILEAKSSWDININKEQFISKTTVDRQYDFEYGTLNSQTGWFLDRQLVQLADYGITFLLGVFTFCIVQYQGIKNHGIGHFTSLFQPVPVLFPINLIGEFANPISISLRLFANLLSGVIMMGLWYGMMPIFAKLGIPAFLHAYLDLFSGCIQTYVFCMLTMVYVNDKL